MHIDYGRHVVSKGVFVAAAMLLTACSTLNEGSTDYRRATVAAEQPTLVLKYDSQGLPQPAGAHTAEPVAKLITKGNTYYIALNQAFVRGFTESFDTQTLYYGERVGEIAIVVRAEEATKDKKIGFNFGGKLSDNKGRVVFFSNDVRQNQFLNFSFMPILGPTAYQGGPIMLDIYVIEVDTASNRQYAAILSSLAKLGKDVLVSTSPAVLSLLDDIGSKLLSGHESDDVEMHYSMVFMPGDANAALLNYPKFEAGDYAMTRVHDRTDDLAWSTLRFDRNTGRLINAGEKCQTLDGANTPTVSAASIGEEASQYLYDDAKVRTDDCLFRGASYLTFQINKGAFGDPIEWEAQTLKQLTDIMTAANFDPSQIETAVAATMAQAKETKLKQKLAEGFSRIKDYPRTPATDAASNRYASAKAFLVDFRLKSKANDKIKFDELVDQVKSEMAVNSVAIAETFSTKTLGEKLPNSAEWNKWLDALTVQPKAP